MSSILKWIGIVFGGLLGLVAVLGGMLMALSTSRLNKTYTLQPVLVSIPADAATIEQGAYLYASACAGCHGDNLSGGIILDDPAIGYLPASNLTTGQGGVLDAYNDAALVRAIRHGISADGKPLMIMPSKAYWYFSDADLGAIIAYLKSAPPVDHDPGRKNIKPIGRILLSVGAFGEVFAAEVLDHEAPRPAAPERGITVEYGEYKIKTGDCSNCHGSELNGTQSPEPGAPFSPNLTPGGVLSTWSQADFIATMRTGVTPYGRPLNDRYMPWKYYSRLGDEDLKAMFLYLQSLPALEAGVK